MVLDEAFKLSARGQSLATARPSMTRTTASNHWPVTRDYRTRLGLSQYAAEDAEPRDKLEIAGKVKDVASVHSTLWPEEPQNNQILNIGILTGQVNVWDSKTGIIDIGPD